MTDRLVTEASMAEFLDEQLRRTLLMQLIELERTTESTAGWGDEEPRYWWDEHYWDRLIAWKSALTTAVWEHLCRVHQQNGWSGRQDELNRHWSDDLLRNWVEGPCDEHRAGHQILDEVAVLVATNPDGIQPEDLPQDVLPGAIASVELNFLTMIGF